jgi:hypothetical protein
MKEITSNNEHHDNMIGVVNPSDVAPNTSKAYEADIL